MADPAESVSDTHRTMQGKETTPRRLSSKAGARTFTVTPLPDSTPNNSIPSPHKREGTTLNDTIAIAQFRQKLQELGEKK